MSVLVVDDRDGLILAELESLEQAVTAAAQHEEHEIPICLVSFHDAPGAILGTDSTVTVRVLAGWDDFRAR